jgi:hypothetical protein
MTNTYTDCLDRQWTLKFNAGVMSQIQTELRLDLHSRSGIETYCKLASTDRRKFVDVLWRLVSSAAEAAGVDEDSFYEGLDGDALHAAELALNEAFIEFQHPSARDSVRQAIDAHEVAMRKTGEYIVAKLTDPASDAELSRRIESAVKSAATKAFATVG